MAARMVTKMKSKQHIAAFTLFEVTIVLGLLGGIVSLLAFSLNRFNEQLKNSAEIQQELNIWYQFRANLWRELYLSDSVKLTAGTLSIYSPEKIVDYRIEEEQLLRKTATENWRETSIAASTIEEIQEGDQQFFFFHFDWKGETMTLSYLYHESPRNRINNHFDHVQ
jgi:hypothetical protein